MRKRLLVIAFLVIVCTGIIIYFFNSNRSVPNINEINSIEVGISGGPIKDHVYIFSEKENLSRIAKIHEQLLDYKDPQVKTWFVDVKLTYEFKDGGNKTVVFKKIRPVDDYFQEVYNSIEYKKQTLNIFNIIEDDIDKIKVEDNYIDRNKSIITKDKDVIHDAYMNSMKTYELLNSEKDYYRIADISFYDKKDKLLANGVIIREHGHWDEFFDKHAKVKSIKASAAEVKEIIVENKKSNKKMVFTDNESINMILDTYYDNYHGTKSSDYSVEIILKDSSMRHWYGSFYNDKVPTFIEENFR